MTTKIILGKGFTVHEVQRVTPRYLTTYCHLDVVRNEGHFLYTAQRANCFLCVTEKAQARTEGSTEGPTEGEGSTERPTGEGRNL